MQHGWPARIGYGEPIGYVETLLYVDTTQLAALKMEWLTSDVATGIAITSSKGIL